MLVGPCAAHQVIGTRFVCRQDTNLTMQMCPQWFLICWRTPAWTAVLSIHRGARGILATASSALRGRWSRQSLAKSPLFSGGVLLLISSSPTHRPTVCVHQSSAETSKTWGGHCLSLIHISEPTRRTPISYA